MAATKEAIANRALQHLGSRSITDITDTTSKRAVACNTAYTPAKRSMLRSYRWNFAIKRDSLTADVDKTAYGDLYRFELPTDFVRFIRKRDTGLGEVNSRQDWQIEGGFIVTADAGPLDVRYIHDADETLFDPAFDEVFAARLAFDICQDITGSLERQDFLSKVFRQYVFEARQANAFENDPDGPVEDSWILARL